MIALITPTGARKDQFELCYKWMKRQTYQGEVLWIIVDDAVPFTTKIIQPDFRENWETVKIYPTPRWTGQNTQARNIREGMRYLKENYDKSSIDAIFIIEDDDYYKPHYLQAMMDELNGFWLIGETQTVYYNVVYRRFVTNPNRHHASLFQTAFTWDEIPILEQCYKSPFIDAEMWKRGLNKHLFHQGTLSVGMKGMPGRGGIGAGHRGAILQHGDLQMRYLTKLIGTDAKYYERYYGHYSKSQHPLFAKRRT